MSAYYNEFDPHAAQWLRNLIAAGLIAPGDVDERSVSDVGADDLAGYRQCHFFAGLGIWSHALRMAGWPDDREVWTGSCPCQPFSTAGQGKGFDDERHLWPVLVELIRERRPTVVFGEQVASKDGLAWLDLVQADMEDAGYAFGAGDICAAGVGAPHIRQRLWFVADAECGAAEPRRYGVGGTAREAERREGERQRLWAESRAGRNAGGLDHHHHQGPEGLGRGHQAEGGRQGATGSVATAGEFGGMGDDDGAGSQSGWEAAEATGHGRTAVADGGAGRPGPTNGYWRDADWLFCRDGKWRPVKPGTFPLVDGAAFRLDSGSAFEGKSRQGLLKGFGNGIVPQVAAQIIEAFMEYRPA